MLVLAACGPDEATDVALACAALRDGILRGTAMATGVSHAAQAAKPARDTLAPLQTSVWKQAEGWP